MDKESASGDNSKQNEFNPLRSAGLSEEQISRLTDVRNRYREELMDAEEARKRLSQVDAPINKPEQKSPHTDFWDFIKSQDNKNMLPISDQDLTLLRSAGINDDQTISLLALVRAYFSHMAVGEKGLDPLRLHFARWLIKTGAISDIGQSDRVVQHLQALDEIVLKAGQKVKQQEEEASQKKTEQAIFKATPYWKFLRWLREHNRMTPPREIVMAVDELDDPEVRERLKAERERLRAEHCTYHAS